MTGARPAASPRPLSIYIIAAEESGDALGAALAQALTRCESLTPKLTGIGGRAMAVEGVVSSFPIDELSIFGFTAIPRRLPRILRRIREVADAVVASRPDALVIIDSPDFTHRVARRVRRRAAAIPILDYVSPSVWAWRPGRARAMRGYVDQVLAILPFEPAVHQRLGGPPCIYVGHPLVERLADLRPDVAEAERRLADPPVILLLPGSRLSEIRQHASIFGAAIELVAARFGSIELIMPAVPHLAGALRASIVDWVVQPRIVVEPAEKWAAFRRARAALAASGTVTLELALSGVPMVAAYRLQVIETVVALLIRLRSRLPSVILANLVIGENVVPEFLQGDCTPQNLADALLPLLSDTPQRRHQIARFGLLDDIMVSGGQAPSVKAASIVLDVARHSRSGLQE
jgi:lipid-A-disaccharide synthase